MPNNEKVEYLFPWDFSAMNWDERVVERIRWLINSNGFNMNAYSEYPGKATELAVKEVMVAFAADSPVVVFASNSTRFPVDVCNIVSITMCLHMAGEKMPELGCLSGAIRNTDIEELADILDKKLPSDPFSDPEKELRRVKSAQLLTIHYAGTKNYRLSRNPSMFLNFVMQRRSARKQTVMVIAYNNPSWNAATATSIMDSLASNYGSDFYNLIMNEAKLVCYHKDNLRNDWKEITDEA